MSESAATLQPASRYEHLLERAIACIDNHGGAIDDARLVSHVFGAGGSEKLWAPLLQSILLPDPRVTRLPNGWWTTRPPVTSGNLPVEYAVLDVETTGLKPRQHRVIEIAIIRYSGDAEPLVWSTLVNPGRQIPDYIRKLTGIDDSMVANAPEFRSIAPTVEELIGDIPIVGHNVAFDISFLNTELVRSGRQRCINVAIDTMALADELMPGARRLALQDVARDLGVARPGQHRATVDAEVTAEVYRHLLHRASERGIDSLEALLELSKRKRPRRSPGRPVGRGRSILNTDILKEIPHAPGVYVMRDVDRRVIYVGKAKDLRKRVGSYYSQPLGYTRKMDGLLESLDTIETTVVGTELEALILESQLIRRYRPRFNTAMRNAEQYSYIKVDITNRWPTVTMTRDRHDDGALYYGPFRSVRSARDAVQLINSTLPIRTCKRSFKDGRSLGSPCIELSLHRCSGPCMGLANPEEYRGHIDLVIEYLNGNEDALQPYLLGRLEAAVQSLDFEKASKLRKDVTSANRLVLEQVKLSQAARETHAVLVLPGAEGVERELWYLYRGRRWAQFTLEEDDADVAERLQRSRGRAESVGEAWYLDHHTVDETAVLARWINRSPDHPALIGWRDESAGEIVSTAKAVDLTVPFGEAVEEPEPDAPAVQ